MLIPNKFNGYQKDGTRLLHISMGGGGGGPTQTTSTVQNTNIPEYAKGYVESMLGATQKQLFNTREVGGTAAVAPTYDSEGNQLTAGTAAVPGYTEITGFKPYQAYGGTYDDQGNMLSYDPSKGIAKINPMQEQAYLGVQGMKFDPTRYNMAQLGAEAAGKGGLESAKTALDYGTKGYTAGLQGQTAGLQGQTLGILGGQAAIANAGRYGDMGVAAGQQGQRLGIQGGQLGISGGAEYGQMGAGYGSQAAGLADTALGYGNRASTIGEMALQAQDTGNLIGAQAQNYARQAAGAGQQYARQATNPYAMQAYMSPYMQNVVDVQNREAMRNAGIAGTQQQAEAAKAGAFGGGRDAIMRAERERNLATLMNQNQAQGMQQAYQQAQQAQQFGAGLGLQGLAGAQQGLGTALQGGQLGLSGLGTALQGQQGALAGVGAANQAYQTGIQGAGMGLQGVNTQLAGVDRQLAGTAQGMQGAQIGLQGVDRALAGTQAQLAGTAQGMQGAGLAMQGAGMGLQGVQGAQAGYGLTNQSAANLTSMLGQQQANQLGLYNNQMAMGNQKMAYDQSILNQAVQDYANAQQYPLMQLGTMSNMLRGLPMQASTTNLYAASPNPVSQAIGTIGAGASIYNAMKPGGAAGGLPSEFKYSKGGGIMSYDMGGEVEEQLESMDEKGLEAQAKQSSSPSIRKMAQRLLRERQMSKQSQGVGPMGVQYQAAQPQMPGLRGGGIIAFQQGAGGNGSMSAIEEGGEDEARIGMQERLAQSAPTTGGIMGATAQPTTPVPFAPTAGRTMQQAPDIPAFMKAEYADAEKRMNAPLSSFMAERQAAMREAGVADVAEGQQKQRAELMAEKANMGEEKERQKYLRLAEFFASWGSTPGPVLVAGLNALQKTVPNIVADEKEQKKARREIDKSIADLDNATRLEKRGEVDAAMALKLKAAEDMKALNMKFIDYQSRRESDASSAAASKYSADMQFRSEQLRSQTAALDRAARRETDADNKIFGQWQAAAKTEADVLGRIQREENDKQHMDDLKAVKLGIQTGTGEDNKFDESKVPPVALAAMKEAQARIAKREANWKSRIEQASRNTDLAYDRVKLKPETAAKDYTKPTGGPQAGASTRPALTDPSLQRD